MLVSLDTTFGPVILFSMERKGKPSSLATEVTVGASAHFLLWILCNVARWSARLQLCFRYSVFLWWFSKRNFSFSRLWRICKEVELNTVKLCRWLDLFFTCFIYVFINVMSYCLLLTLESLPIDLWPKCIRTAQNGGRLKFTTISFNTPHISYNTHTHTQLTHNRLFFSWVSQGSFLNMRTLFYICTGKSLTLFIAAAQHYFFFLKCIVMFYKQIYLSKFSQDKQQAQPGSREDLNPMFKHNVMYSNSHEQPLIAR